MKAVEHLLGDLSSGGGGGVVDGAELLVALPGDVHLVARVTRVQAMADLGLLLLGEVFRAVAEQPADLVERVVFVAAPTQGVLLNAAADLRRCQIFCVSSGYLFERRHCCDHA